MCVCVISPSQDISDAMAGDLAPTNMIDQNRAHSNYVLHWLTYLGYNKLCTDFTQLGQNRITGELPPKERLDFQEAITKWTAFWAGSIKLLDLCPGDEKWVMACPEGPDHKLWSYCRVLQENLLQMLALQKEFQFGLLVNVHRLPFAQDGNEDLALGIHFFKNAVLDLHLWPFIDKIIVLSPEQRGQFGSRAWKPVERFSYHAVIQFSHDAKGNAQEMLKNMMHHTEYCGPYNGIPQWGAHRADLNYVANLKKDKGDLRLLTWKFCNPVFPSCTLAKPKTAIIESDGCMLMSVDIAFEHKWLMDNFVWSAGKYKHHVTIEAASRLSQGNWGQDRLFAWDVTVHPKGDERFNEFVRDLTATLQGHRPMICCPYRTSLDAASTGKNMCLIEFGHSDVLQDLMKDKIICWVGFVMPKMAVVALDGPDKSKEIIIECNQT